MYIETYIDLQQHASSAAALAADAQQQSHASSRHSHATNNKDKRNSCTHIQASYSPPGIRHAPLRTNSARLLHEASTAGAGSCSPKTESSSRPHMAAPGHAHSSHHSRAPSSPAALHSAVAAAAAAAGSTASLQGVAASAVAGAAAGLHRGSAAELGSTEEAADSAMHAAVASTLMCEQGASSGKVSLQHVHRLSLRNCQRWYATGVIPATEIAILQNLHCICTCLLLLVCSGFGAPTYLFQGDNFAAAAAAAAAAAGPQGP
jgi:hypothetical protein